MSLETIMEGPKKSPVKENMLAS